PAPSSASARTTTWTTSSPRSSGPHGADGREHGDRPRLDRRLPAGAAAVPELANRAALRPLRQRELPGLRRPWAGGVLRAAAQLAGDPDDVAADARRLLRRLPRARARRQDLLAAHRRAALRDGRERENRSGRARRPRPRR